jgi:hypothetical protein
VICPLGHRVESAFLEDSLGDKDGIEDAWETGVGNAVEDGLGHLSCTQPDVEACVDVSLELRFRAGEVRRHPAHLRAADARLQVGRAAAEGGTADVALLAVALGVIVFIFQRCHGSKAIWGLQATDAISAWIPLMSSSRSP